MVDKRKTQYYQQSTTEVETNFKTSIKSGLTSDEVINRQKEYGSNQIETHKKVSKLKLFFDQFKDALIVVLIFAATISLGLSYFEKHGAPTEAILIYGIVLAIAVVGFLNEYKAEKTVDALRKLVGFSAKVIRDDDQLQIPSSQLVPGDVVTLNEGDKVPADIRLVSANLLKVNEASLTGESQPTGKQTGVISKEVGLGDQKNMLFSGTIILTGTATGIVVATGSSTEIGKIASLVEGVEQESTPMQNKLDKLGRQIGAAVLAVSVIVFVVIFFLDKSLVDLSLLQRLILAFTAAVALAVAAIPEGLAFVVRISLALGARRMADKNALVRKLSAVEALGSTDVICSDKTGTLTRGEMTVRKLWTADGVSDVSGTGYETDGELSNKHTDFNELLKIGLLCNDAKLKPEGVVGDPTEASLLVSAAKVNIDINNERVGELPFSSERKMMTTIHKDESKFYIASKGAPEQVLHSCEYILKQGKPIKLTEELRQEVLDANKSLASAALRVLGFAYKHETKKPTDKSAEEKLIFVGLQGMMDPPRKEVMEVISRVQSEAGMRVIMITGDYIETAKAVADEIGIKGSAISGIELEDLSEDELLEKVEQLSIYARVNPEHKIRIVKALQKNGHQVAMTGDGVNDSPAIKAANIGIAMGITGTDATKEAADMILMDDQFLTIISAIEEGRGIFDNIRKFVNYLLSANIAEVITILFGVIFLNRLVLSASQLLFINIVTDGLPAVALGSDPSEKGVMRFKPWHFQGSILNPRIWVEMVVFGLVMSVILIFQFIYNLDTNGATHAVSAAFAGMVIFELVRLIDIRTDYKIKWFSNPWLSVAILGSFLLQLGVLYIPPLADLFDVGPISAANWLIIAIGSVGLFVMMKILNPILDRWMPEIHS